MKISEHPHIFITGLVYPAFLGAFLYEAVQGFLKLSSTQYILVFALIFLFSWDYLYTTDKERKKLYNVKRMFLDVGLVFLLYISLRHALKIPMQNVSAIWLYLALFKFLSLVWEWAGVPDKQRTLAAISHSVFLVLYGLGWFFFGLLTWVLISVLLLDALISLRWESLSRRLRHWIKS